MGYIYMLTSPSGKTYIGQTFRPIEKRLEEHRTGQSSGCVAIYNAIQYHGWNNFEKDWYECPDEELNKHEELMVEVLGTLSPGGYNLREGGGSHGKMSEESKQKNREAHLGKTHTDETKQKIGEARMGKTNTEETKQRMREAQLGEKNHMYGKIHGEYTKRKMSEAQRGEKHPMYGKTHSEETKKKQSETKKGEKNRTSKRVYQYDLNGTFIDTFGSGGEAALHIEGDKSCIGKCARGKSGFKTAYGFKWSYIKH